MRYRPDMPRLSWVFAIVVVACGGKSPPPIVAPAAGGAASIVTLKALENGDRACYVVVESAAGEQSIEGSFELCAGGPQDASALIGQRVTYTTERANVQAAACEGDPDCGQSDEVDLVISITAAP